MAENLIKEYSPVLEYISGYGMIESCNNNHVITAYKVYEQDYKLPKDLIYVTTIDEPITKNDGKEMSLSFIMHEKKSFFQKQFAADEGFYLTEQINSGKDYRACFFTSDHPAICERMINNLELVKGFVTFFKEHNQHIIESFDKIRTDFSNQKNKYFREPNDFKYYSKRDHLLAFLNTMDALHEGVKLTKDEWILVEAYNYGKLYHKDMSHVFNISKDDMKARFDKITHKLLKEQRI